MADGDEDEDDEDEGDDGAAADGKKGAELPITSLHKTLHLGAQISNVGRQETQSMGWLGKALGSGKE